MEPSEKPIDSVDALLFWINKICLLVRDDVEREDPSTNIPEMEDLYEDISDGQCLCALLHWYRPQEMPIAGINFIKNISKNARKNYLHFRIQFTSGNFDVVFHKFTITKIH